MCTFSRNKFPSFRNLLAESTLWPVSECTEEFQPSRPQYSEADGEEGLLNISDNLQRCYAVWSPSGLGRISPSKQAVTLLLLVNPTKTTPST